VELSLEREANLRGLALAGPVELRENAARVAPLPALSREVRGQGEKPLLHLWSAHHNRTRRVLAITDQRTLWPALFHHNWIWFALAWQVTGVADSGSSCVNSSLANVPHSAADG